MRTRILDLRMKLAAPVYTAEISPVTTIKHTSHGNVSKESYSVTSAVITISFTSPASTRGDLITTYINADDLAIDTICDIQNHNGDILLHSIDETINDPRKVEEN